MLKTIMKDYSKRKNSRYVVWSNQATMDNVFGRALSWHPSLKDALQKHPDAKPAQGCLKADGTRKVLK